MKIPKSIYLLESITLIPIQILYDHDHFEVTQNDTSKISH